MVGSEAWGGETRPALADGPHDPGLLALVSTPVDDQGVTPEDGDLILPVLDNDTNAAGVVVGRINGVNVSAGDVIQLASGATVTVQADGALAYNPNGAFESLSTGQVAQDSFTYETAPTGFSDGLARFSLSALNGSNGFRISGVAANDSSGYAVASAGDINGDGYDDVLVGALYADPHGDTSGASYVIFGKAGGFDANFNLADLNGSNGFKLSGVSPGDLSGQCVASAGDLNGDGHDDLIIGAFTAKTGGVQTGAAYVVFGKASGFDANLDLSSLNGLNGFKVSGVAMYDSAGISVGSAGDFNGDGYEDLIVGASQTDTNGPDSGSAYLIFGKASGFDAVLDPSTLNGSNGCVLVGVTANDYCGYSTASAGDLNGDGFDDLIIGGIRFGNTGGGYVVFGRASGLGANFSLGGLDGTNGFRLNGVANGDQCGDRVAAAGDVNGDGYADLIIGASQADPNGASSGASYVVFGKASGFTASINLASLDGSNGFKISGSAGDWAGLAGAAGDVNGDGYDDLVIGAPHPNGGGSGSAYVVFGKASGFAANFNLASVDGVNGFQLSGVSLGDITGVTVSAGGDVNHDGFADLIVGAYGADVNGHDSGATYVLFGSADLGGPLSPPAEVTVTIEGSNEVVLGTKQDDMLVGGSYADDITGRAGNDHLYGGAGDDTLSGGPGDDVLDGGDGVDTVTYAGAASGVTVSLSNGLADGGAGHDTLSAIENLIGSDFNDVLSGFTGPNTLDGGGGSDTLSGFGGDDTLMGGAGDDLLTGGAGNDALLGGDGRDTASYASSTAGVSANLLIGAANGGAGNDILIGIEDLIGSGFGDTLVGDTGANCLDGGGGDDVLMGGKGRDVLVGGAGQDTLAGGLGKDTFLFTSLTDSSAGLADRIVDFDLNDRIDLSAIDADTAKAGDQKFHQVAAFDGHAAELLLVFDPGSNQTLLTLDVNGDGLADFALMIAGDHASAAGWRI